MKEKKIYNHFNYVLASWWHIQAAGERGQQPISSLPRRVVYALQEPIKEELERLKRKQQIVPIDIDKMSEWCNSIVLVPKANSKVRLCLDPARLTKVLIWPMHKGLTLNDILPRIADVKYLTLIDAA